MLDHRPFAERREAIESFRAELSDLANTADGVSLKGQLTKAKQRTIVFLDTPDLTLRNNGLVLRRRAKDDDVEYTLKCRSEDRYFAAGTDLRAGEGLKPDRKLEEDIAPPFRCRFSLSNTVEPPDVVFDRASAPTTVGEAAALFPFLGAIRHDGRSLPGDTPLGPVNRITAFERVFTGADLVFEDPGGGPKRATVALILWSDGKDGRPMVAEFSFRVEDDDEAFTRELARSARSFFELVQQMDWCRPDSRTKTEFVYRDRGGD